MYPSLYPDFLAPTHSDILPTRYDLFSEIKGTKIEAFNCGGTFFKSTAKVSCSAYTAIPLKHSSRRPFWPVCLSPRPRLSYMCFPYFHPH